MKHKVGVIIAVQIAIISSSFLVLSVYQNQSTYLGNTINTSGMNRYLAELLYARTMDYLQSDNQTPPTEVMRNIDMNIYSLSHVGALPPQVLFPMQSNENAITMVVPSEFSNDFKQVQDKWAVYRTDTVYMLDSKDKNAVKANTSKLQEENMAFIVADNNLTVDLSTYSKQQSQNLIILQFSFLIVNVCTNFFLLRMMMKIIKQDYAKSMLLDQTLSKQQQLISESRLSTLQKDILGCFFDDMTEDLHKLKKQIQIREDPIENRNNKIVLNQITDMLLTRINQLAESKQELEDQKSYYRHLNKKLENSISILSKDGKKNEIKKTEDLIAVMQSYVDRINILTQTQKLPPHLGKNLTVAIEEIIDHLSVIK
jgi:hypothetical protein